MANRNVPVLLGFLAPYLDMGLMVERMPWSKNDANAVYVDGRMVKNVRLGVKMVCVAEVLFDRWGGKGGDWGTFVHGERGVQDVTW